MKNLLSKFTHYGAVIGTAITIDTYAKSLREDLITKKQNLNTLESLHDLQKVVTELSDKNIESDVVLTGVKSTVEASRSSLDRVTTDIDKYQESAEKLKSLVADSNPNSDAIRAAAEEFFKNHENVGSSAQKASANLTELSKILSDVKNNFMSPLDSISELIIKYKSWLETLTLEQMGAIINILLLFSLWVSLLNLLAIVAGDRIIAYFNLEIRLPWAARLFSLRKTVQKYSFIWNFIFIILIFMSLFIFNLFVLTKNYYLG